MNIGTHDSTQTPLATVHIKGIGDEWQVEFTIGVQHFDIGPRYEKLAEAEWFMHQFNHALGEFVKINTGVTLAEPR